MKRKNNKTKIVLLILIICITLGYAVLRTGLNINGIATIPNVSWDVYFSNYQNSASTNVTPTTEPSTPVGTKPTTVSYAVTLSEPGDLYEFTIDIVNNGTIDANINLVSKLDDVEIDSEHPIPDYLTYKITDTSDVDIPEDHRLNKNTTETIKVKLLFKTDIDPEDLPSEGAVLQLDIELTATQAPKPPTTRVGYLSLGNANLNKALIYTNGVRSTPEEAMADWGEELFKHFGIESEPFYLKLDLRNAVQWCTFDGEYYDECFETPAQCNDTINEVIEEYPNVSCVQKDVEVVDSASIDFVVTEAMAEANLGMVPGTYTFRSFVDESESAEKPVYEANVNQLKTAFGYATYSDRCTNYSSSIACRISDYSVSVSSAGGVNVDHMNLKYNNYTHSTMCGTYPSDNSVRCMLLRW